LRDGGTQILYKLRLTNSEMYIHPQLPNQQRNY